MVPHSQMNRWENNSCLKVKYQSLFPWCTFLLYWLGSRVSLFIHSNSGGGFMQFTGAKMHGRVREGTKMFKTIWICVTDRPKMEGQWCWGAWVPLEENVSHSFFSSFSHLVWFLLGVPYVFYPSVPLILTLSIFAISLPLVLSSHAYSVEYDVIIKSHQLPDNMSDASMSECVDDITQCQPREEVGGSLSLSSYEPILFLLKRKDERIIFSL